MKPPVFLRIYRDGKLENVKQFDKQDQIVIGTNDDVALQLQDDGVSPLHAVIEERDSGYYLSDLGSQLGTSLNGEKTFDDQLKSGDEIQVGPYKIQFFIGVPKPEQPPVGGKASDVEGAPPPASAKAGEPKIEIKAEPKKKPPKDKPKKEAAPKIPKSVPAQFADTGTYAPKSERSDLDSYLTPGKGPIIEVVVAWKERIISTNHFSEKGAVTMGSNPKCDIVVPLLGSGRTQHKLLEIEELATVCFVTGMDGDVVSEKATTSLGDLVLKNKVFRDDKGFKLMLGQGEMVHFRLNGGLLNIYIRYIPEVPKPLVAPILDFSASEITGVIFSIVVAAIFGLYMLIYSPSPDDETKVEEPIRKAVVQFKIPKRQPPKVVQTKDTKTRKKVVRVVSKPKQKKAQTTKPQGKAAAIKKSRVKKKAKKLGSARPGGATKTGKKAASAKSKKRDTSKLGLLGVLSGKGTQKKLDQTFSGSGGLIGAADQSTGYSGAEENRAGDNIGTKLKATGSGSGSSTIGIGDVGTKGRGTGHSGSGGGGIGKRGRVDVNVGGQEAEFVGSIDREAIRRVILANKRAIKACYDRALARNKNLYGKLVLQWHIEDKGRVTSAKTVSNSLGSKQVANCILRRLRTWRFPEPPPNQIAEVRYPFVFTAQ